MMMIHFADVVFCKILTQIFLDFRNNQSSNWFNNFVILPLFLNDLDKKHLKKHTFWHPVNTPLPMGTSFAHTFVSASRSLKLWLPRHWRLTLRFSWYCMSFSSLNEWRQGEVPPFLWLFLFWALHCVWISKKITTRCWYKILLTSFKVAMPWTFLLTNNACVGCKAVKNVSTRVSQKTEAQHGSSFCPCSTDRYDMLLKYCKCHSWNHLANWKHIGFSTTYPWEWPTKIVKVTTTVLVVVASAQKDTFVIIMAP